MCGRYALNISEDQLATEFLATITKPIPDQSNWNISPTSLIPIINAVNVAGDNREVNTVSWGLIPSWAKDGRRAVNAINARVESIADKPTFRSAFRSTRCLIPVSGYYEWATELGEYKPKQPFYISSKDSSPLALAGVYEVWINPESKQVITSAAIITRPAFGILTPIHHRMPVILPKDLWSTWLSSTQLNPVEVKSYLSMIDIKEADSNLTLWPVSDAVNNARNFGPQLATQIKLPPAATLF